MKIKVQKVLLFGNKPHKFNFKLKFVKKIFIAFLKLLKLINFSLKIKLE